MVRSGPTRSEKYTGPEHYYNSYAITPQSRKEDFQHVCKFRILSTIGASEAKPTSKTVHQTHGVDYYSVKVGRSHLLQEIVVFHESLQSRDPHYLKLYMRTNVVSIYA